MVDGTYPYVRCKPWQYPQARQWNLVPMGESSRGSAWVAMTGRRCLCVGGSAGHWKMRLIHSSHHTPTSAGGSRRGGVTAIRVLAWWSGGMCVACSVQIATWSDADCRDITPSAANLRARVKRTPETVYVVGGEQGDTSRAKEPSPPRNLSERKRPIRMTSKRRLQLSQNGRLEQ